MHTTPYGPVRRLRHGALAALAVTSLLAAAGCGSDNTSSGSTPAASTSEDTSLSAMVPADVKADGKIVVGTDPTYAPNEFLDTDGKTVIGFDVDLFDAVAGKLGLKTEWVPAPFGAIITGVKSNKYEIGVSSFTVNAERQQVATMVSYFSAGTQWSAKKGNPAQVDPSNACGKNVAVQKDTVQVQDIQTRSALCTKSGKPGITVDQYAAQDAATAAIVSGKDDAGLADSPVMAYAVKQTNGQLELLGDIYDSAPYGYVLPKTQVNFGQAIAMTLKALIDDGSYEEILKKWGVEAGAIDDPTVNPAVS